jgi:hypothetical protein
LGRGWQRRRDQNDETNDNGAESHRPNA